MYKYIIFISLKRMFLSTWRSSSFHAFLFLGDEVSPRCESNPGPAPSRLISRCHVAITCRPMWFTRVLQTAAEQTLQHGGTWIHILCSVGTEILQVSVWIFFFFFIIYPWGWKVIFYWLDRIIPERGPDKWREKNRTMMPKRDTPWVHLAILIYSNCPKWLWKLPLNMSISTS